MEITSEVEEHAQTRLDSCFFIKENTGFRTAAILQMINAADNLLDVTVTYDPDNPDHARKWNYNPSKPLRQKVTMQVQRTTYGKPYFVRVTLYTNA